MKFRNAIIIDSDPVASSEMTLVIDSLYSNIYAPIDPRNFIRDVEALTPDAVFVNLALKQRDEAFAFLEKMLALPEQSPVIYGYSDSFDPELWGAAIDHGVQEVFCAPFDPSGIIQKIKDTELSQALPLTPLPQALPAKVHLSFEILEIDEGGLTLSGKHHLSKGAIFTLNSPLMNEIFGASAIELMVTKTGRASDGKTFTVYGELRDFSGKSANLLRQYVLSKIG